jgi:sugar phosphate isomerase/epimerase
MRSVRDAGVESAIISFATSVARDIDHAIDALTRLSSLGERMALRLHVRNVCDSVFERLDVLHELFARVKSPALGLCVDNLEFQRAVVNPADAVLNFNDRLGAVRLRDELRGAACNLGDGGCHVRGTLRALSAEGFSGSVYVDWDQVPVAVSGLAEHFS